MGSANTPEQGGFDGRALAWALQKSRPPLSTHQLFELNFVEHSVHRKQALWKTLPCAVARSATYTVFLQ